MDKLLTSILVLSVLLCGCSEKEDTLTQQRDKLVSYLTTTHAPKLVEQSQVGADEQLPYYTALGNTVYRYVVGAYDPDRPNRAEVTASSKVTITFRAYLFNFANITDDTFPFFSNDPLLKQAYINSGLDPEFWKFEPMTVDMRGGDILKGLRLALLGCRAGDEVESYMTYNMAYDDRFFGILPRQSAVAWFFTIDKVE